MSLACLRVFSSACSSAAQPEHVIDGWFWVSGSPPGMAGAGAGILTLLPSPRYCYQPGMASGFTETSVIHQGLPGKKLLGQQHCPNLRCVCPPGQPFLHHGTPSPAVGPSHRISMLELFQRLCEAHSSLPQHPLPCPVSLWGHSATATQLTAAQRCFCIQPQV